MPLVPLPSMKRLGVILYAWLTMKAQISSAAQSAFYHLQLVRQLVPYLTPHPPGLGYSYLSNGHFQTRLLYLNLHGAILEPDLETTASAKCHSTDADGVICVDVCIQPVFH